ncbi:MAG: ABC transporter ATP-binding protein [Hyphomicrobiales bacterium]
MASLELRNVVKNFGAVEVNRDVNLTVEEGEFVVLVGPSGCGKTTLLRLIAGLEQVTAGEVLIGGQDMTHVDAPKRGLAMVFQSYALYPHMTVERNMRFGLENLKMPDAQINAKVHEVARNLRMEEYLQRLPRELSGGQRQRVAIGRAIVRDPKIFLFDEPLSNLDAELRVTMRKELARLHKRIGGTMIYVTHDQTEAMTLADRIVVMDGGKISQVGTPLDLYFRPANRFVAGFIGSPRMNMFQASMVDGALHLPGRPAEGSASASREVLIGVRPEHFRICETGQGDLDMSVQLVEQLGDESFLYCENADLPELCVRLEGATQVAIGDRFGLQIDREHMHVFDTQSGEAIAAEIGASKTLTRKAV